MTSMAFIVGLALLVPTVPPKLAAAASAHPSLSESAAMIFLMLYVVFQTFPAKTQKNRWSLRRAMRVGAHDKIA